MTEQDDLKAVKAEFDKLRAETAQLKAELARLVEASKPPKPFVSEPRQHWDPTANFGMPKSAVQAMVEAVPDRLMSDLRGDVARGSPVTAGTSQLAPNRTETVVRGSGYRDAVPFGPQPGINYVDEQVRVQDEIDRADLARRLARSAREKG